ncbi:oxygenase MpaB family protein [uncultured Amnibacterium sp.]|uniref:oxygenase MpaB family protein n=1 Tax=uncultured Amnibacterium sp. TaxID=1631851 RepID=UPI0035CC1F3C
MASARRIPSAEQLLQEGVLVLGGLRALLLELADPAVGHGVAEHSGFAANPLGRLHGTLTYVYLLQADEPRVLAAVADRIVRLHAGVRSAPGDTPAYDARHADLQLWVAATIHDTAIRMAELVWGPLPTALKDELLALDIRLGTSLGMPAEAWPADTAAFDAYFAQHAATLRFDDTTWAVVRQLFSPTAAPLWVRAAMPVLIRITAPLLPAGLGAQLGLAGRGRILLGAVRALAPVYRAVPRRVRTLPRRRYLAAARRQADRHPARVGAVGTEN